MVKLKIGKKFECKKTLEQGFDEGDLNQGDIIKCDNGTIFLVVAGSSVGSNCFPVICIGNTDNDKDFTFYTANESAWANDKYVKIGVFEGVELE